MPLRKIRAKAARLSALLLALLLAHSTRTFAQAPGPLATALSPPLSEGRLTVEVGLFFINLIALDEVTQEFKYVAYLFAKWKDPRLAVQRADPSKPREYDVKALWIPTLEVNNAAVPRQISARQAFVDFDGTVHYVEKFTSTVQADLHFRAFPFDRQALDVYIHPFVGEAQFVRLKVYRARSGVSDAPYVPLPLWDLGPVTQTEMAPGADGASSLRFRAVVTRDFHYYVWRMFVPLFLLVCMSWSVLWMPPGDLSNQVLIAVSTIFTLVVFSSAVSSVVPPVPYLTFYDAFFLVCYVFVLLTLAEVIAIHGAYRRASAQRAVRLRRRFRWLLPCAFGVIIAAIAGSFGIMR
jgi:hypothetical protein